MCNTNGLHLGRHVPSIRLALHFTCRQHLDSLCRRQPFKQHSICAPKKVSPAFRPFELPSQPTHDSNNRRIHIQILDQLVSRSRRFHTLRSTPDRLQDFRKRLSSLSQFQADGEVTRGSGGGGKEEIADPGETDEGEWLRAKTEADTGDFGEASGD